jgi:hypothetical protein
MTYLIEMSTYRPKADSAAEVRSDVAGEVVTLIKALRELRSGCATDGFSDLQFASGEVAELRDVITDLIEVKSEIRPRRGSMRKQGISSKVGTLKLFFKPPGKCRTKSRVESPTTFS